VLVFCASHPSKVVLGSSASSSVGQFDDGEACEGDDDDEEGPAQNDGDDAMGLENGSGDAPVDNVGAWLVFVSAIMLDIAS
jgi:hypothetical protein